MYNSLNLFQTTVPDNLFINYLSRIHRDEDFSFVLRGFTRLLNNPLVQTYLPNSTKKVQFHQELLVFFWKMCDYNKVSSTLLLYKRYTETIKYLINKSKPTVTLLVCMTD